MPLETGTEALEDRGPTAQTRGSGSNRPETVRVWPLGGFKVAVGSREMASGARVLAEKDPVLRTLVALAAVILGMLLALGLGDRGP